MWGDDMLRTHLQTMIFVSMSDQLKTPFETANWSWLTPSSVIKSISFIFPELELA